MRFRRFRNGDVPGITVLWNGHQERIGCRVAPITFNHFQTAVLDRQTFSIDQTLVAEDSSGELLGFAHFPIVPDSVREFAPYREPLSRSDVETTDWTKAAVPSKDRSEGRETLVCFLWKHGVEPEVGVSFLDEVCRVGVRRCGLTIAHRAGYVGLAPDVGLAGILESEPELSSWLISKGYRSAERWRVFGLPLADFRIPVDRVLMALRRTTVLEELPVDDTAESLHVSGWGHLDPLGFALKQRGNIIATVSAWVSGFGSGMEVLIEPARIRENAPEGAEMMLLSETIRELSLRKIDSARTAIPEGQKENEDRLNKLGFRYQASGSVFVRD
jgi:hypothetical protein